MMPLSFCSAFLGSPVNHRNLPMTIILQLFEAALKLTASRNTNLIPLTRVDMRLSRYLSTTVPYTGSR